MSEHHLPSRRRLLLGTAALPLLATTGCALVPFEALPPLARSPLPGPGPATRMRAPAVGQRWTYAQFNQFNSALLDTVTESVASVGGSSGESTVVARRSASGRDLPQETHRAWGQLLRDAAWDYPLNFDEAVPLWPAAWVPGSRQALFTRYRMDGGSFRFSIQVQADSMGWERVTVQAGTFSALRVERLIRLQHEDFTRLDTIRRDRLWLAPEVGRFVARETSGRYLLGGNGFDSQAESLEDHFRWELTGWA